LVDYQMGVWEEEIVASMCPYQDSCSRELLTMT
jgi:hypothetical protein